MSLAYSNLLHDLARHLGLDGDALAASEEIIFKGWTVCFEYLGIDDERGELSLFAPVGRPPSGREADVYRTLLAANNRWLGTGGATLGLHEPSGQVVCCARVPLSMLDGERLTRLLDMFIAIAAIWRDEVQAEVSEGTEMPAPNYMRV